MFNNTTLYRLTLFCTLVSASVTFSVDNIKSFNLSSMQGSRLSSYNHVLEPLLNKSYYSFINHGGGRLSPHSKIPKIIHFIWIGGKLPYIYNFCLNSWQHKHPDWKIILWDDDKIKNFEIKNRKLFDALANLGAKADILRLEILSKFGGLYVDVDFFCLKQIDCYLDQIDLFLGKSVNSTIGNGIIGASPNHPFINQLIQQLTEYGAKINQKLPNGQLNLDPIQIMDICGPDLITKNLPLYLKDDLNCHKTLILPQSYLHSFPNHTMDQFWNYDKSLVEVFNEHAYPETIAIHLWSVSWVKLRNSSHKSPKPLIDALNAAGFEYTDLNFKNIHDGTTALHVLSKKRKYLRHLKNLILAGADLNAQDKQLNTPLMYALSANNHRAIRLLVAYGANPEIKNAQGQSALSLLATKHQPKITVNEPPLVHAARTKRFKEAEILIRYGYNPNIYDKYGRTPLFYAAINNDINLGKLLILNGADTSNNYQDHFGKNIQDYASMQFADLVLKPKERHKIVLIASSHIYEKDYKKNLLSLFNQTYSNWELFVIDDSDNSLFSQIHDFAKKLGMINKIRFIKDEQELKAALKSNSINDNILITLENLNQLSNNHYLGLINQNHY